MEMQNVKNQAKKAFTPARIKKAAVLAMLVSLVSAGGAYYHHQQAQARSVAEKQARSEMITAQASQRGIVLIDEAHVRTIAADALGKNESDLTFHTVQLELKDSDDRNSKHSKHKDGKHNRDSKHTAMSQTRSSTPPEAGQAVPTGIPANDAAPADSANVPMTGATAQSATAPTSNASMSQAFHPVYKVKCHAGKVEYKLRIDAVTGMVLTCKVNVDDDIL